ncbi:hypothetical protein [Vibrio campbellii]|uniref:hypothetical protein n=1 Tax=Vibrio campbellii TaxID=680 RepID=UPI00210926FD|nr:hypothetical protein [Vibrio campbellii]UTZ44533.1 hypothetical protein HB764_25060 [Vibrio campbellii]
MNFAQFDSTRFCGNMWVIHNGEKKFVVTCSFPERLFGLLPEKPADDEEFDPWEIEWVRCENVTEVLYTGGDNVKAFEAPQDKK